jgi:hypothetical protein
MAQGIAPHGYRFVRGDKMSVVARRTRGWIGRDRLRGVPLRREPLLGGAASYPSEQNELLLDLKIDFYSFESAVVV